METVIGVIDLRKRHGEVAVVDGTSFEVEKGKISGLLGPNGAGKIIEHTARSSLDQLSPQSPSSSPHRDIDDWASEPYVC